MKKLTSSFATGSALILLCITPSANATYTFTDLGASGSYFIIPTSINNAGQVVGNVGPQSRNAVLWNGTTVTNLGTQFTASGINNAGQIAGTLNGNSATLLNGATAINLGNLGGNVSSSTAINNAGQVVGTSRLQLGSNTTHATLWNGTTATDLGTLGGYSYATAINDVSQVAGYSYLTGASGSYHAIVWNGTTATDLGTLGGNASAASDINNASQVVGTSFVALSAGATYHATLWNGTTATDLGTLGGTYSQAFAINNTGQTVGWSYYTNTNAVQHATLWNGTVITDLNSLLDTGTINAGWVLNKAVDINDNGWIVGTASRSINGISQTHGFLLSQLAAPIAAVPEPETYAMLLAGLGLMGFVARRRKSINA